MCNKDEYSSINSVKADSRCSSHPHNIYFEILAETGLIGIMFFLYLIIRFIKYNKIAKLNFIKDNPEVLILSLYFLAITIYWIFIFTWNGFFIHYFFHIFIVCQKNIIIKTPNKLVIVLLF